MQSYSLCLLNEILVPTFKQSALTNVCIHSNRFKYFAKKWCILPCTTCNSVVNAAHMNPCPAVAIDWQVLADCSVKNQGTQTGWLCSTWQHGCSATSFTHIWVILRSSSAHYFFLSFCHHIIVSYRTYYICVYINANLGHVPSYIVYSLWSGL